MHLRRQTIFRDFPNVSLHVSMVLLDFSMVLLDSSIVLFNFSVVLLDFLNFSQVLLDFSTDFIPLSHSLLHFSMVYSIFKWFCSIFPLCHCFSMVLLDFSTILRFHSQSPQMHLGGRTSGESIPHRHPIATWHITLKKVPIVMPPLHLIP